MLSAKDIFRTVWIRCCRPEIYTNALNGLNVMEVVRDFDGPDETGREQSEALTMTANQKRALREMYRQGLHVAAAQAEQAWHDGQRFEPDQRTPLGRGIEDLIRVCNWEVQAHAA